MAETHDSWRAVPLGEIAEINPKGEERLLPERTEVSFVSMASISADTAAITGQESRYLADVSKGFTPFHEGDVLFAKITPCMEDGKVAIARGLKNQLGFGSTEFHVIRTKAGVSARWVWYFLRRQAVRDQAVQHMTGSGGQRRVPVSYLRQLTIPLPSTQAEQDRIADILDEADAARHRCVVLKQTVDELLPAVFDGLFGDPDQISERWPTASLERNADIVGGLQLTSVRNANPGVSYLRVANVYRNRLDLHDVKQMAVAPMELASHALLRGDVLVVEAHGEIEELGRAAVWTGTISPCVYQNRLIRARARGNELRPEYLSHLLNSPYGRQYFQRYGSTGSGLNTISVTILNRLQLPLPPPELQERFADMVREAGERQQREARRAELIADLFVELLEAAFQGGLSHWLPAFSASLIDTAISPTMPAGVGAQPEDLPPSRPVWRKLSETQRRIWQTSRSFRHPFSVTDLTQALKTESGSAPPREHLIWALDLLVTLGVVIKEDRQGMDLWRHPNPENDREIEI